MRFARLFRNGFVRVFRSLFAVFVRIETPLLLFRTTSEILRIFIFNQQRTSRRRRPRCSRYAAHTKHGKAERYLRYGLVRIRALAQSASGQPEVASPGAPRTPPHVPNLCFPERNEAPVKTLWVKRQPRPQDTITQSHSAHTLTDTQDSRDPNQHAVAGTQIRRQS